MGRERQRAVTLGKAKAATSGRASARAPSAAACPTGSPTSERPGVGVRVATCNGMVIGHPAVQALGRVSHLGRPLAGKLAVWGLGEF